MADEYLDEVTRRDREMLRQAYDRYQPDQLIGLPEAEARTRIEAAGGTFEVHAPGEPVSMDLRLDRVRVEIVDGRIATASIG